MHETEAPLPADFHQAGNTASLHGKALNHGLNNKQPGSRHLMEDDTWDDGGHAVVEHASAGTKAMSGDAGSKQADSKDNKQEEVNKVKEVIIIKSDDEAVKTGTPEPKTGAKLSGISPPVPPEASQSEKSDVKKNNGVHVGVSRHLNASEEEKDGGENEGE
jgi:hypothetical protein